MSAEKIVFREAIEKMRAEHGPEHPRHGMWAAMADLLEHRAAVWQDAIPVSQDRDALAVATAYLEATLPTTPDAP